MSGRKHQAGDSPHWVPVGQLSKLARVLLAEDLGGRDAVPPQVAERVTALAAQWTDHGFTAETVQPWTDLTPACAAYLAERGVDPGALDQLIDTATTPNPLTLRRALATDQLDAEKAYELLVAAGDGPSPAPKLPVNASPPDPLPDPAQAPPGPAPAVFSHPTSDHTVHRRRHQPAILNAIPAIASASSSTSEPAGGGHMVKVRPADGGGRWVEISPERIRGWLDGFYDRHDGATEDGLVLTGASNGDTATLYPPPGIAERPTSTRCLPAWHDRRGSGCCSRARVRSPSGSPTARPVSRVEGRALLRSGPHRRGRLVTAALRAPAQQPGRRRRADRPPTSSRGCCCRTRPASDPDPTTRLSRPWSAAATG